MNPAGAQRRTYTGAVVSTTIGLLLALTSGLMSSGACFLVQHTPNIHPGQHAVFRSWVYSALALPYLIIREENIFGPSAHRTAILFAAFINATAMILTFMTVKYLPLGEAAVMFSSYPAFVTVAGRIFLKEKFGILEVSADLMIVVGVIFTTGLHKTIADPSRVYSTENFYGLALGLATALTTSVMLIVLRKLRNIHFSVIMFHTGIVGVIESLILAACMGGFNLPAGDLQRVFIILIGCMSAMAFLCMIVSLKYGEAGPLSATRASSEIFFSFLLQVSIFGHMPDGLTVLGSVLVCLSVVLIGLSQRINKFLHEKLREFC